eukprot:6427047-Amphidinium_carterae.1
MLGGLNRAAVGAVGMTVRHRDVVVVLDQLEALIQRPLIQPHASAKLGAGVLPCDKVAVFLYGLRLEVWEPLIGRRSMTQRPQTTSQRQAHQSKCTRSDSLETDAK